MKKLFVSLMLSTLVGAVTYAVPANSTVATRNILPYPASIRGTNIGASGTGTSLTSPVWYEWTTTGNGIATIDVTANFDSYIEIYISSVDDPMTTYDLDYFGYDFFYANYSFIPFTLNNPGTNVTYYIAVFGRNGNQGDFTLSAAQVLAALPDNFAAALALTGKTFKVRGLNSAATTEIDEPRHANVSNLNSVWFKWTANSYSSVTVDTIGCSLDTVLAVYTGSTLKTLTAVKSNDDISTGTNAIKQSKVTFVGEKDVSYYIVVAGKNASAGSVYLNLEEIPRPPDFAKAPTTLYAKNGSDTSVQASAIGTGTITYQWQRKPVGQTTWSNLADDSTYTTVTGTTLHIAKVSFAMNGDQFRSVATDANGTTFSLPTTLTITEFAPFATTVGGLGQLDLTNGAPIPAGTTYYVTKLPAGFVLNAATGQITTSPTVTPKPGSYTVSYGTSTTGSNGKPVKGPAQAALIVVSPLSTDLSGSFEALLEEPSLNLPAGKVELLVNSTTGALTGKLTSADEAKVYALKGKLALNTTYDIGTASIVISRGKGLASYRLDLDLNATSPGSPVLSATLNQINSTNVVTSTLSRTTSGVKLATYSQTSPFPWQGKSYNFILDDPSVAPVYLLGVLPTPPAGTGFGAATVPAAKKGLLTFKGKLGDGTLLTASLAPSADGSYLWYVKPYKTSGFFGGWIQFAPVTGGGPIYKLSGPSDSELYWQKSAGSATDKSYRAGFGPIGITAMAQTWDIIYDRSLVSRPLATSLKLTASAGVVSVNLVGTGLPAADVSLLPTSLKFSNTNAITEIQPAANADKFTLKVNTNSGSFIGGFTLQDKRKVTFEGLFILQPDVVSGTVVGEGFFTIPSLAKGGENVTGKIQFVAP